MRQLGQSMAHGSLEHIRRHGQEVYSTVVSTIGSGNHHQSLPLSIYVTLDFTSPGLCFLRYNVEIIMGSPSQSCHKD